MSFLDTSVIGNITIGTLILFIVVLVASVVVARLLYVIIRRRLDEKTGVRASKNIARLVQYITILVGFAIAFGAILKFDLGAVLVSLGVISIAVAFAVQQVAQNMIAGILISILRPIQIEDWVEFGGSLSTGLCRVSDLTLMYTILRNVDGDLVYIPNSSLLSNKILNYTKAGFVALNIPLWVEDPKSLQRFREMVLEEAQRNEFTYPEVEGVEKPALTKALAMSSIMSALGPQADRSVFNPSVVVTDIQLDKIKVMIRIWINDVQRRDLIVSSFLEGLRARTEKGGAIITKAP